MKFLLLSAGVFFATGFLPVKAQGNSKPIKFIENIQIIPGANSGETDIADNKINKRELVKASPVIFTKNTIEKTSSLQFKYALLLDEDVEAVANLKLFNFIDEWMDTRYRYGGSGKDGIDCSAFSSTLENDVYDINIPRTAQEQYDLCDKVSKDDLKEGDLVFFNTRGGVSHVGVYLDNGFFVHSSIHGVIISSLNEHYYDKRFINGGRIPLNNN